MDLKKFVSDHKKLVKYLKIACVVIIVALFLWFLVIHPLITFKGYEREVENAAKRYYELNERQLPTGTRVKTLSVQELFNQAYLKEDFYVPLTDSPCSITESWVKVRREDGEYKYYVYLKCGIISSIVDHKGPEITLNGDDEITIDRGSKYEELGVKSVVDNSDGRMDVEDVEIDSSDVNTNVTGTYDVTYTAYDSLRNKTEVVRKVNVVSTLSSVVKEDTGDAKVYQGNVSNNYMYFSGMVFRIVGLDGDNVRIVAEQDVSNVNYDAIDEWLEYYYDHIADESKDYVVYSKYCNDTLTDQNISTAMDCSSYTDKVPVSILSAQDYNKATDADGYNYLYPESISWVSNGKDDTNAYGTRSFFYYVATTYFMGFDRNYNFGVRPALTINGDALVVDGDGSEDNPYSIGDFETGKAGDKLNTRQSGEYVSYSGMLWRVVDSQDDGTTKVIADTTLYDSENNPVETYYETDNESKVYNPEQRGNVGYFINNTVPEYIDSDYFVNKEIEVPIYKRNIKYGEEATTKTYKVRFAAPDMYEMFSAHDFNSSTMLSYWYINSSRRAYTKAIMSDIGTILYGEIYDYDAFGIRPVAFFNKQCVIVRGKGTIEDPYIIEK